jgi:hypothetical protein
MTGRIPYDGLEVVESESRGRSWPAEGTGARDPSILEGQNRPARSAPQDDPMGADDPMGGFPPLASGARDRALPLPRRSAPPPHSGARHPLRHPLRHPGDVTPCRRAKNAACNAACAAAIT